MAAVILIAQNRFAHGGAVPLFSACVPFSFSSSSVLREPAKTCGLLLYSGGPALSSMVVDVGSAAEGERT